MLKRSVLWNFYFICANVFFDFRIIFIFFGHFVNKRDITSLRTWEINCLWVHKRHLWGHKRHIVLESLRHLIFEFKRVLKRSVLWKFCFLRANLSLRLSLGCYSILFFTLWIYGLEGSAGPLVLDLWSWAFGPGSFCFLKSTNNLIVCIGTLNYSTFGTAHGTGDYVDFDNSN